MNLLLKNQTTNKAADQEGDFINPGAGTFQVIPMGTSDGETLQIRQAVKEQDDSFQILSDDTNLQTTADGVPFNITIGADVMLAVAVTDAGAGTDATVGISKAL